jgi:hypothetical protein
MQSENTQRPNGVLFQSAYARAGDAKSDDKKF